MATTDKILLRCSRWQLCGRDQCEHYEPHYERSLIIPTTGRSICYNDKCSGKPAVCEELRLEPCWEV